jgi:glycosyltransferase involved in cell wall biosynthesis
MNILYFSQHFSTPQGSTGQRAYEMARKLIARRHTVTIVCGSYKGGVTGLTTPFMKGMRHGNVDGIHVIEFNLNYANHDGFLKRTRTFLRFVVRSIKLVFTLNYDVIFATTTPLTVAVPGILGRWLRRKPFIFEVRDLWPELPKAMGVITNPFMLATLSLLERISYYSANQLIALSPGMLEGIVRCGIPRERVHLVSNGCDFHLFENTEKVSRPASISDTDLMAVYAGTHGIANGLGAVLDAALVLKKRGRNDIKLVLIGDGKLKPVLQKRAKEERLDNVLFLEPLPKRALAQLILSADLGLQILANVPAFYDGTSPNKFFDYIAAGLPVLINYSGWLSKKVAENGCGFVVPPDDAEAFASALEAAADSSQLKKMGKNARQLAEQEFNRNELAEQWVNVIEKAQTQKGSHIL